MSEWTAVGVQAVNPGETIVFTENPVPCRRGFVRHRDGTGNFLLSGANTCPCGCNVNYLVDFAANIAIAEGGEVEAISVAITVDGATVPASIMEVTPAAAEEYFNVSRAINVPIWKGCCETVSIRNTSSQPISVVDANVIFTR